MSSELAEMQELKELIELMYVPEKDFIEQLPKEGIMYIHFKTVGKQKMGDRVDNYSYMEFENTILAHPQLGNADMQSVLKELDTYFEFSKDPFKQFNFKNIFDELVYKNYPFYSAIRSLLDYLVEDICTIRDVDFDSWFNIDGFIEELDIWLQRDTPAFNLALCIGVIYKIIPFATNNQGRVLPFKLFKYLTMHMIKNKAKIHSKHVKQLYNLIYETNQIKSELNRKTDEIHKLQKNLKDANKNRKVLEQQVVNNGQIKDYLEGIGNNRDVQSKAIVEYVISELKNYKTSIIERTYEGIIEKLNNQISDLKSALRDKVIENKRLKEDLSIDNSQSILDILKKAIEMDDIKEDIFKLFKPYIDYICSSYQNSLSYISKDNQDSFDTSPDNNLKEISINKSKVETPTVYTRIGYCKIIDNGHFLQFPDGSVEAINNIPEGTYLAEGQFILINAKNDFKYAFQSYCNDGDITPESIFMPIDSIDERNIYVKDNEKVHLLSGLPKEKIVKPMQIIAVDKNYKYLRHFTRMYQSADNLYSSVKAKGHLAYFVLKVQDDDIFQLRNIETNENELKKLEIGKFNIKPYSVITVNINRVVSYFPTGKFYTLSSYYNGISYAIVKSVKKDILVSKIGSDEEFKLLDVPYNLTISPGAVVKIDEFNNLIDLIDFSEHNENAKKRLKRRSKQYKSTENIDEIKKSILIVGNISYRNSYTIAFQKKGYRIDVVDGYENWSKVSKLLKNVDLAILITDFCSHDNMWKLKDDDVPTIFSEFDGANRVLEQVENIFS